MPDGHADGGTLQVTSRGEELGSFRSSGKTLDFQTWTLDAEGLTELTLEPVNLPREHWIHLTEVGRLPNHDSSVCRTWILCLYTLLISEISLPNCMALAKIPWPLNFNAGAKHRRRTLFTWDNEKEWLWRFDRRIRPEDTGDRPMSWFGRCTC